LRGLCSCTSYHGQQRQERPRTVSEALPVGDDYDTETSKVVIDCQCGTTEDGQPMVQCNKCAIAGNTSCAPSEAASTSAFLCHLCRSDASPQSSPTLTHQFTQSNAANDSRHCTCAFELSQLRQDVLDMKVQMKNQLKVIYNTLVLLSNASQPLSSPLLLNKIPPAPIRPPLPLVPTVLAKE